MAKENNFICVAIDGYAGSGKTFSGKKIAEKFGFCFLSSGILYRAFAFDCIEKGIDYTNREEVICAVDEVKIEVKFKNNESVVFLNGQELISEQLYTKDIEKVTPFISQYPEVREKSQDIQLQLVNNNDIVLEGRDIGTVVVPDADIKFFFTSGVEIRAKRRYQQQISQGEEVNYYDVLQSIIVRDIKDKNRAISPLVPAQDAIIVDTSATEYDAKVMNDVLEQVNVVVEKRNASKNKEYSF